MFAHTYTAFHDFLAMKILLTMLNYAPPNTYLQKKFLELEAAKLEHLAWKTANPAWLDALRSCTEDIYDTDLLTAISSSPTASRNLSEDEPFSRANEHDTARADALPVTSPHVFENEVAAPEKEDPNPLRLLLAETLAEPAILASHDDIDVWNPQRRNPKPNLAREFVVHEGVGEVEMVGMRSGTVLRRRRCNGLGMSGKRRCEKSKAEESVEVDSDVEMAGVVGGER